MSPATALSRWLKQEMPRHGYPLEGPRAGGTSRLADDAGVSRAALSRIITGQAEPSPGTLRAIGKVLGYPLGEMLVFAGLAEADELTVKLHAEAATGTSTAHYASVKVEQPPWWLTTPPPDLWTGLVWDELSTAEQYLWHLPDTSPEIRMRLVHAYNTLTDAFAKVDRIRSGEEPLPNPGWAREANGT